MSKSIALLLSLLLSSGGALRADGHDHDRDDHHPSQEQRHDDHHDGRDEHGKVCEPTKLPTATIVPTARPTATLTTVPAAIPTSVPTAIPTAIPTAMPTAVPTAIPTAIPTDLPTAVPTLAPTDIPTPVPTPTAVCLADWNFDLNPVPTVVPGNCSTCDQYVANETFRLQQALADFDAQCPGSTDPANAQLRQSSYTNVSGQIQLNATRCRNLCSAAPPAQGHP